MTRLAPPDPATKRAQVLVRRAVSKGLLVRQPCEVCGTTKQVTAYHPDPNYPMQVHWLCRQHRVDMQWLASSLLSVPRKPPTPSYRSIAKSARRQAAQALLPPGVTGPHRKRYGAIARNRDGRTLHLGFFRTIEEAEKAIAAYYKAPPVCNF